MKRRKPALFNVWPVVQRELREGARRPINHRLRLASASAATLLLWFVVANLQSMPSAQVGAWLFASLQMILLVSIVIIVPALSADCIAREKRDGTLGLLFLTPLSAGGIVAGKALAHGLRALTLWLSVLPLLTIPFTTGGVNWFGPVRACSVEFSVTVLCLAAGVLASSLARQRSSAFLLAFLFGVIFLLCYAELFGITLVIAQRGFAVLKGTVGGWALCRDTISILSGMSGMRYAGLATSAGGVNRMWIWMFLASPPIVLVFFWFVARFAARRIELSWQDKIHSARRENLLRRYCTPVFRRRFRRKNQRLLDWNPIAWLQQYSWKSRMSKWGLCLVFVLVGCATLTLDTDDFETIGLTELLILAAVYTFVGVSGFLEEKRNGALELLLVTPISVNKLIFGRTWGLWKQFLPACLALACFYGRFTGDFTFALAFGFLAMPIFATYAALRVKNLIVAALLTWIALPLPLAFSEAFIGMFKDLDEASMVIVVPILLLTNGAFALLTCFLLRHSLSRRIYSF